MTLVKFGVFTTWLDHPLKKVSAAIQFNSGVFIYLSM